MAPSFFHKEIISSWLWLLLGYFLMNTSQVLKSNPRELNIGERMSFNVQNSFYTLMKYRYPWEEDETDYIPRALQKKYRFHAPHSLGSNDAQWAEGLKSLPLLINRHYHIALSSWINVTLVRLMETRYLVPKPWSWITGISNSFWLN